MLLLVLFVLSIVLAVSFVLSFCYFSKGLSFRSIDDEMETRAERIEVGVVVFVVALTLFSIQP